MNVCCVATVVKNLVLSPSTSAPVDDEESTTDVSVIPHILSSLTAPHINHSTTKIKDNTPLSNTEIISSNLHDRSKSTSDILYCALDTTPLPVPNESAEQKYKIQIFL